MGVPPADSETDAGSYSPFLSQQNATEMLQPLHRPGAEAKGGQLVHLFRLVEQTMALVGLVTSPGLFQKKEGLLV